MTFEKQKEQILSRTDKSQIGAIDKDIMQVVDLINSMGDYFTSSSCSGRIFLIEVSKSGRKDQSKWLMVKHDRASLEEIKTALNKISSKDVWLVQESMILHICCRDINSANKMLILLHNIGLKRAGIITVGRKIVIEAFGTDRLETIVAKNKEIIVTDDYLRELIRQANTKYEKNLKKIDKLFTSLQEAQLSR